MSNANDKAGAKPMPVTGGCCGIRPSKEAMEVDFGVDFSEAKRFLSSDNTAEEPKFKADSAKTKPSPQN